MKNLVLSLLVAVACIAPTVAVARVKSGCTSCKSCYTCDKNGQLPTDAQPKAEAKNEQRQRMRIRSSKNKLPNYVGLPLPKDPTLRKPPLISTALNE